MASEQYRIPWAPLDISRGVADLLGTFQQNRENARANDYLDLARQDRANSERRISAEEKRRQDATTRQQAIEAFTARPILERMARRSVSGANENPYGIKFEEGYDLPSNVEGPEMSPAAEAARFAIGMPKAGAAAPPVEAPATLDPAVGQHSGTPQPNGYRGGGIDAFGDDARQTTAENVANVGQRSGRPSGDMMPETPELPPSALAAASALGQPGPQGKHRIYEVGSHGDRFELPEQSDKTPFGADYDSIYQGLLEAGEDPHKAMQYVSAQYKADQTQQHIADRAVSSFAFRDKNREDQQTFQGEQNKLYRSEPTTAAERERLARIRASAQTAGQGNKDEASVDRAMSLINQRAKAFREIAQYPKLVQSDKTVREIFNNIAAGSVNLQNRDAQIQMAKYFRGSIPTGAEMVHLYTNLGGTQDAWNRFVNHGIKGSLTPEEIHQLRVSATAVKKEHEENKHRAIKVGQKLFGPGSGVDNYPDQAQAQFDAHLEELGIDPAAVPKLYQTEGGASIGSFSRPKVQPRGTQKTELDHVEDALDRMLENGR